MTRAVESRVVRAEMWKCVDREAVRFRAGGGLAHCDSLLTPRHPDLRRLQRRMSPERATGWQRKNSDPLVCKSAQYPGRTIHRKPRCHLAVSVDSDHGSSRYRDSILS